MFRRKNENEPVRSSGPFKEVSIESLGRMVVNNLKHVAKHAENAAWVFEQEPNFEAIIDTVKCMLEKSIELTHSVGLLQTALAQSSIDTGIDELEDLANRKTHEKDK